MLEDVVARIESLGYTVIEADSWLIDFIITKVQHEIYNACNINEMPQGLHSVAVDMAAGEFLLNKKASGQLTGFDLESAIKQIKEGDTTVTFDDTQSPEKQLDNVINYLISYGKKEFIAYRTFRW